MSNNNNELKAKLDDEQDEEALVPFDLADENLNFSTSLGIFDLNQEIFDQFSLMDPPPLNQVDPLLGDTSQFMNNYFNNVNLYPQLTPDEYSTNPIPLEENLSIQRQEQDVFHELINMAVNDNQEYLEQKESPPINSKKKNERIYELSIIQQPIRARMCGYGDKDRRPISPVPILQLTIKSADGQSINIENMNPSFLIVACDSCSLNTKEKEKSVPKSTQYNFNANQIVNFSIYGEKGLDDCTTLQMRNLVGSLVTSALKLYDLDGNLGIFYVFTDISIRSEGTYKLKVSLIDIESPDLHSINTVSTSRILQTIESDPFYVYTAKQYPGVVKTTPLSICFSRQGIKIPSRQTKK